MSSSKEKAKHSRNRRLKDRLSAMKDFITGSAEEDLPIAIEQKNNEPDTPESEIERERVGQSDEPDPSPDQLVQAVVDEPVRETNAEIVEEVQPTTGDSASNDTSDGPSEDEADEQTQVNSQEVDVEQIVEDLRGAKSVSERVLAVGKLGRSRNQRAAAHLVAAMFDDEPQVRLAAEEAMAQLDKSASELPTPEALDSNMRYEAPKSDPGSPAESGSPDASATSEAESKELNGMVHLHLEAGASAPARPKSSPKAVPSPSAADDHATEEELKLIQEHQSAKLAVEELHEQIFKVASARTGQEKQALWRTKREAKLRAEVAQRIIAEEEARKLAEDEAQVKRLKEIEAIEAEMAERTRAEAEAYRLAESESRLRLEAAAKARVAGEILQRHEAAVRAREQAAREAQHLAAQHALAEAQAQHNAEVERLRQEEESLHLATQETARRRGEVEASRQREEQDAKSLAEAEERMRTSEEIRAKAEQARQQLEAELLARVESEERALVEARQHAQEEHERLAEELRRHQESVESELAALHAKATQSRVEAEKRNQSAIALLRKEELNLQSAAEEATRLRAEAAAARERAEKDVATLLEAHSRMRVAEEARAKAEASRVKVEAELLERLEEAESLLTEARQRASEEQRRLEKEAKLLQEAEERRLEEVEAEREAAAYLLRQLSEQESQITSEIESLRNADTEARKRLTAAEAKKSAAEQANKLLAEQIQRLEAEAHTRTAEEQQMRARIETEKRNATSAAQYRAEHEKQIREEIEALRRLEQEETTRLKSLAMERADVEASIARYKDAALAEAEARRIAESQLKVLREGQARREADERESKVSGVVAAQSLAALEPGESSEATASVIETDVESATIHEDATDEDVPDAVASYLRSPDPYKRAAAVTELARSKADDAFGLILACFDDQSAQVRNAAASALQALNPSRIVDSFNRALENSSDERRSYIGAAIAGSGLATEAVNNLASESRESTYNALSILFVMAKAGEITPLVQAIEEHESDEVRRAVIKLLTLSGHSSAGDAALQRRVVGVTGNRQAKTPGAAESDLRSKMAAVEVKRAVNGKQKSVENKAPAPESE